MKRITFIVSMFAASVCLSTTVSAQERKFCGQATELEKMRIENPKDYQLYLEKAEELENHTRGFVEQKTNGRGDVYIVPIVFHIIHDYGLENISDDQVRDAVRIINEDFRKLNADTSDIVAAFKAIAGDSEIEFRLAQKDPFGNCTNGIIRVASKETYKGETPSTSNVSRWPRANYLNVWVVKQISSGAAGYTNYPSVFHNSPSIDGIMILNSYVGSIGTGDYTSSRALTHEIGHWINLAHTWGNSNNPEIPNNCNGDDGVTDTPNTIGWTSCNLAGNTCSSLDNVQNYMDYSYCDRMFTQGQSTRMRAALESSIAQRSNLWQPSNLALTGTTGTNDLCVADFNASQTEVCVGETVQLYDASYNNPTSWNWTFTGAAFVSSPTVSNPTVVYNTPGQYNVQLQVSDGVSSQSTVKSGYITVLPSTGIPISIQESFESVSSVPGSEWFVFNPGDVNTWEIANVGATGSKSISIKNRTNPAAALNEISSTTIDLSSLSTSAKLSFKVAFAQKTLSNNDELRLFASYNCGKNWVSRWNRSGQNLAT
ncbi:MAG: M43 family zinc metalloprotease, partial [Bacteroidota bacterium]|nr:M43 family zinc metalloprotease [Bacteroidota bacterium]